MTAIRLVNAVKICGLRNAEHAATAARSGADLIGFIFAPARRQITAEAAAESIAAARAESASPPLAVGVFVNASAAGMNAAAERAGLDLLQLHGDEDPALLADLSRPAIKALRPRPGQSASSVQLEIDRYLAAPMPPIALIIDGFDPTHHGGQGIRADWTLAATLATEFPLILAGGLNPDNVAAAIESVGPIGVDVSSGVEIEGAKDHSLIQHFVTRAKRGFEEKNRRQTARAREGAMPPIKSPEGTSPD